MLTFCQIFNFRTTVNNFLATFLVLGFVSFDKSITFDCIFYNEIMIKRVQTADWPTASTKHPAMQKQMPKQDPWALTAAQPSAPGTAG
jgi:hypothetical protein